MRFERGGGAPIQGMMYVGGRWIDSAGRNSLAVENPADESVIATIPEGLAEDADVALDAAKAAQPGWAALPAVQRADFVLRLADRVAMRAEELARIITMEQGKPIGQARGEVGAVLGFLRYHAGNARRIEGDIVSSDNINEEIQIRRHPFGVVVALTAWNYPAALAARKLAPALVAGNTVVLLSHEVTPLSGLFLALLAEEAGLPAGVFNVVTGRGPVVGRALVQSRVTSLVTMTGSTRDVFSVIEEEECLIALLSSYEGQKDGGDPDPVAERLLAAVKAKVFNGYLLYEIVSRVDPHAYLLQVPELQREMEAYVRQFVLVAG